MGTVHVTPMHLRLQDITTVGVRLEGSFQPDSMHRGSHSGVVVLEVLQCSAAEEAKTPSIIVAAIDATHPEGAIHGFQEGRLNVLYLAHPHLDLHVAEKEVPAWLQVLHLQRSTMMCKDSCHGTVLAPETEHAFKFIALSSHCFPTGFESGSATEIERH